MVKSRPRKASVVRITALSDPAKLAKQSQLRYVMDDSPGITRKRTGKGFIYINAQGRVLRQTKDLRRIQSLAIPPPGNMCGSVRGPIVTCRPQGETHEGANNIATIRVGVRYETRRNSTA